MLWKLIGNIYIYDLHNVYIFDPFKRESVPEISYKIMPPMCVN